MKAMWKQMTLALALLAATSQQVSAQAVAAAAVPKPVLLGTTGACNNQNPGGTCTQTSKLVQLDPVTFQLIREIGPVGFTVNGLAWDQTSGKLYATTAIGDAVFHGLITIDPATGAGTPVDPTVHNFGLPGADSPIHSIAIDPILGTMQAWYDEFPPPVGVTDTFVWINKRTGVATEFTDSGIDTFQNGLAWQLLPTKIGPPGHQITIKVPHLWNIDAQNGTAWEINPLPFNTLFGKPVNRVLSSNVLSPPIMAALGDFNPVDNLYYGLSFTAFCPTCPTNVAQVDPQSGNVTQVMCGAAACETVKGLHVMAFVKH